MELDELKAAWQVLEQRVQQQEALNRELLEARQLDRMRARLRWFAVCRWLQIAFAIALVAWVAPYWLAHRAQPALLVSGLALHVYGVALAVSGILEALITLRLQAAHPVLVLQRYIGYLKAWRGRIAPWLGLSHWLLWVAAVLVLLDVALGLDLWAVKPSMVLGWLGFSAVGLAVTVWLLYGAPARLRDPLRNWLQRSSIGDAVLGADRLLDEVARFERG